jgi:DNA-binding helix-hairpin-helix protein with protein kinase domain
LTANVQIPNLRLFDGSGQQLSIAGELGHGGEGVVYELVKPENLIVKIYDPEKLGQKGSKIKAMIGLKTEALLKVAAWPIGTVHFSPGGDVVGLLEQKAVGFKDIHLLYSPKSRKIEFPSANWNFLIRTAANLAIACEIVHGHGHVIGDMNPNNMMVSPNAIVKLIDCDSFQISYNSYHYSCGVGVPIFTPPELQNKDLTNMIRTQNHDNFGLALLIFHLLFLGRHPFAGKYLQPGEMPIEKAIAEFRFAYGIEARSRYIERPPNTLQLKEASEPIGTLFERAFQPQAAYTDIRPTPQEWIKALENLLQSLTRCSQNNAHNYPKGLASCPWCSFEQKGIVFFLPIIAGSGILDGTEFDLESVWSQISHVASPGSLPSLPPEETLGITASFSVINNHLRRLVTRILAIGLSTIGLVFVISQLNASAFWSILIWLVIIVFIWKKTGVRGKFIDRKNAAQHRLNTVLDRWRKEASDVEYIKKFTELQNIRDQYIQLSDTHQKRIQELNRGAREHQLQSYLDQFKIEQATIAGIGLSKKAMLASYAIETAADVEYSKIDAVPGFGPFLTSKIVAWRKKLERDFIFDPKLGTDPVGMAVINREINATRARLQSSLMVGAGHLTTITEQVKHTRNMLWPEVMDAYRELVQAKTNLKAE